MGASLRPMTNELISWVSNGAPIQRSLSVQAYMQKPDTIFNKYLRNLGTPKSFGFHQIAINGYPSWGFSEAPD
jgi:hypothetical protein